MIPDLTNPDVSRQELIDLLSRITKSDDEIATRTNDEPDVTILDDTPAVEEGEIITLDGDDDDVNGKKEIEDGEITESEQSDNDNEEELTLRLSALRSLAGAKKQKRQKPKKFKSKRKRSRYMTDDIDLRSPTKNRFSSRYHNQTSNHDDREYLLDKDYRQPSIFDVLMSIISPDNTNSTTNLKHKSLADNYDIQQMDIVDDYPIPPPLPPLPPPLPPNHLPFFDPLPPLPPPPPSIVDMFATNQSFPSTDWPRPNFVQQSAMPTFLSDVWQPTFNNLTDVDLRLQSINHQQYSHFQHSRPSPVPTEHLTHRKAQQPRRKRSKKRHERQNNTFITVTDPIEKPEEQPSPAINNDEDDLEEHLLREQLLRTLTKTRQVKTTDQQTNAEPERIVTIEPTDVPALPLSIVQVDNHPTAVVVTKPVDVLNQSQYSINQRYKRVKANVSSTSLTTKVETTTTTVVRPTQAIFQTRNKIVRGPDTEMDIPQSNPIIINFDDQTSDDEEQQQTDRTSNGSTYPIADEERQAIKRLQQVQEEVVRRTNAIELTTKVTVLPKVPTSQPSARETIEEAIPSTDELSAILEKRRMLLIERSKYGEIQEKMKKTKLENGLFAREIEKLEEKLLTKKAQITNNNALLQYWQKEAMAIAQNIKQQEGLILQSAVFKSVRPTPSSVTLKPQSTIEFDYANISKVFERNNAQLLLSLLICPWSFYQKLHPYRLWLKTVSKKPSEIFTEDSSHSLLRTRSFRSEDDEQYWKTSLQAYFIDINQILCPYELQGSCKAQHCIYQHQYQISQRIDQFLASKQFDKNNRHKSLSQISTCCSLQTFETDLSIFERKVRDKQCQRCRTKLDRYLSIYQDDFRYFQETTIDDDLTSIHPILTRVSHQLDSDDFSPERAVADLVEGLESQRTNAQLWCLYLEFSSWHMSDAELHHLCSAALKNAQSYDLFWTIFYLSPSHLEEFLAIYCLFIQSDQFDFAHPSYAICELAMFDASLASDCDQASQRIKNYLSNSLLDHEHRVYLISVLLYIFAFGSFPAYLYQQMDDDRFEKTTNLETFICPWYALSSYSHSHNEIDQFFDHFLNPSELAEINFALYVNKIHYLNATKRFDQSKEYTETLIEAFPSSIELWMELLSNDAVAGNLVETLDRARQATGIYFEFVYALSSSSIDIRAVLNKPSAEPKTSREKLFSDLCYLLFDSNVQVRERRIEENLLRYHGELRDIFILDILFHLSELSIDVQRRIVGKILNYLLLHDGQHRSLLLYSFFRLIPIESVFDLLIDCVLSMNIDQHEWMIKVFTYRLLDVPMRRDRNTLLWTRFDVFVKQLINHTHSQEIYLTILQRLLTSLEDKTKIARLCRLFEKQYPNSGLIPSQLRQIIFSSTTNPVAGTNTTADLVPSSS